MVTGNEYIFEDIFQARDYILKIEQEKLKSDTFHQKPPLIFLFLISIFPQKN